MTENYNLYKSSGEYSVNTISYGYKIQSPRKYASDTKFEGSQLIKVGGGN